MKVKSEYKERTITLELTEEEAEALLVASGYISSAHIGPLHYELARIFGFHYCDSKKFFVAEHPSIFVQKKGK